MPRFPFGPLRAGLAVVRDATRICLDLFKIMVPILIAVKILKELGWITYLAKPLAPLMGLVGLPPECGLTFATAMANNLYAALAVHAALVPSMPPLSVAQATVLGTMMLISHNLFVEGAIAQKCGAGFWGQVVLRVGAGFACGGLLWLVFSTGGWLAEPAPLLFVPAPDDGSLLTWALGELKNLGLVWAVISCLVGLMRLLERLGVTRLFEIALVPFLGLMGIGRAAATITVIGLVMGLAYGGGAHPARGAKGPGGPARRLFGPEPHEPVPRPDRGHPADVPDRREFVGHLCRAAGVFPGRGGGAVATGAAGGPHPGGGLTAGPNRGMRWAMFADWLALKSWRVPCACLCARWPWPAPWAGPSPPPPWTRPSRPWCAGWPPTACPKTGCAGCFPGPSWRIRPGP